MEEFEIEESEEKKHYLLIGIIVFIFFGCGVFFYMIKKDTNEMQESEDLIEEKTEEPVEEKNINFKVDIKGAVQKPGVYEVIDGSRVIDVIARAGGLKKDANTSLINLSKKITDEMTIIIYTDEDIEEWRLTNKLKEYDEEIIEQKCPDSINQACIDVEKEESKTVQKEDAPSSKISLNNATKEQLITLSGIGAQKAEDIIEYRSITPFKAIEEIKNIKGIGDSIFEKIKNSITV